MLIYFVRNIVGFLLQLLPLAALCIAPFQTRFKPGLRRFIRMVATVLIVSLIPFSIAGSVPLGALEDWRYVIQNIIFITATVALFVLYARCVDATLAQKTFTFLMVMTYGYVITQTEDSFVIIFLNAPGVGDNHMYTVQHLVVAGVLYAFTFVPMLRLTRYLRAQLDQVDDRTWWLMCALPAAFIGLLFFAVWLPQSVVDIDTLYSALYFALGALILFQFWWVLRTAQATAHDTARRLELESALHHSVAMQQELNERLERERQRTRELAQRVRSSTAKTAATGTRASTASAPGGASKAAPSSATQPPIVLTTASQAVSFRADDVLYAESLNRTRAIHLADGETITTSIPLASVVEALPHGCFAYCHRSVVVNLACVRAITRTDVTLTDGTEPPVSRRRYQEFVDALAAFGAS